MERSIALIGAPADTGGGLKGCLMGPDALRTAGIVENLENLGHRVRDLGNFYPDPAEVALHHNRAVHHLSDYAAMIRELEDICTGTLEDRYMPIFIGGDHSIAAGILPGLVHQASQAGQEQFLLWLDAHPDFQTLETTESGNLHGTPVAYMVGEQGFEGSVPALKNRVKPENICMMGIRSVDPSERERITETKIEVHDMRAIDETGFASPLDAFLKRVEAAKGRLHVSLDVDFLDPDIAPAVGTTVPGGANYREAHLIMEMLYDSGLVTSMDISELNPFLDERGKTATLLVDLVASLFGRQVFDRPVRRIS